MYFYNGAFVSLGKLPDNNLIIILNSDGWQEKEYISSERWPLESLLEDFTYNGWITGDLDELGALSNAPYITDDYEEDYNLDFVGYELGDGPIIKRDVKSLWFYEPYKILDPIEELYKSGYVIFTYHEEK